MSFIPTFLAVAPFVLFIILLWRKVKLTWVSLGSFAMVSLAANFYWKMKPVFLVGSLEKGFFVALDIFFIILGAIFFLEIMRETKIIENIGYHLESISKDLRVQVIFLAWFFENFLEGTAGFGTPSTVVAPLLVGLGIGPINAVIIALLGNSASVVFGAAGAPIKIGFSGLAGSGLPLTAAMLNLVGILVPVFILWFLTRGKENSKKEFIEALPFALWAGIAFAIPSILSIFVGQAFPSILGSIVGLILVLITTKLKIFIPKTEKELIDIPHPARLPLPQVLFPYVLLIGLLIAGKFVIGSSGIQIPIIVKHTFSFFNPGFAFIIAGVITLFTYKKGFKFFTSSVNLSFRKSLDPFLVIVFMSAMAQIMVNSAQNFSGLSSMIDFLASGAKNMLLPLWSPFLGAIGSFLTGSATVSNLMFGHFLAETARNLSFNTDNILALALVGGAAGNMIALADMLAAETVVGIKHEEKAILKGVIVPCLIYVGLVGIIGMFVL